MSSSHLPDFLSYICCEFDSSHTVPLNQLIVSFLIFAISFVCCCRFLLRLLREEEQSDSLHVDSQLLNKREKSRFVNMNCQLILNVKHKAGFQMNSDECDYKTCVSLNYHVCTISY